MTSYIDELRQKGPPAKRTVLIEAIDPDVDIMGWCSLLAEVGGGAPPIPLKGLLQPIRNPSKLRGVERAQAAVTHLWTTHELPSTPQLAQDWGRLWDGHYAVVESQRVYANPNASREKLVAQSNDLLRLAHVAGACQVRMEHRGARTSVVLPATWKGQRSKHADHGQSIRRCIAANAHVVLLEGQQPSHDLVDAAAIPAWEHALDALGMALYGMDEIAYGRWT